jgi:hypothetical protein
MASPLLEALLVVSADVAAPLRPPGASSPIASVALVPADLSRAPPRILAGHILLPPTTLGGRPALLATPSGPTRFAARRAKGAAAGKRRGERHLAALRLASAADVTSGERVIGTLLAGDARRAIPWPPERSRARVDAPAGDAEAAPRTLALPTLGSPLALVASFCEEGALVVHGGGGGILALGLIDLDAGEAPPPGWELLLSPLLASEGGEEGAPMAPGALRELPATPHEVESKAGKGRRAHSAPRRGAATGAAPAAAAPRAPRAPRRLFLA